MTYDEVVEILGQPRRITGMQKKDSGGFYLCYGWLHITSTPSPLFYKFVIGFDANGEVWTKEDPFGGSFSEDSMPSKVKIILPQMNSVFSHFPRVLDIRWIPASGAYPMNYVLEVQFLTSSEDFRTCETIDRSNQTHAATAMPGAGIYRVHVRGTNEAGLGEWSDYIQFSFQA